MLSPEVWNFAPPKSSTLFKLCENKEIINNIVGKQLFHHHVSVTIPNAPVVPQEIIDIMMEDNAFYRINKISVEEIFCQDFVELFVKNGKLTALSIKASTKDNDFCAFSPQGEFILVLNKELSQKIGLPHKNLCSDSLAVYVFTINFHNYEDVYKKLLNIDLQFDIIVCWEPNDKNICPSSIANYFCKKNFLVKTCNVKYHQRTDYNISVPSIDSNTDYTELLEWLGVFNLQCSLNCDNYISTYSYYEKTGKSSQICSVSFSGLFSNSRIEKLISKVHEISNNINSSNWVGIVINGFESSVIRHKKCFEVVEDHHHTIIFKGDMSNLVSFFCYGKKLRSQKKF